MRDTTSASSPTETGSSATPKGARAYEAPRIVKRVSVMRATLFSGGTGTMVGAPTQENCVKFPRSACP
jgi:hypothetical protein